MTSKFSTNFILYSDSLFGYPSSGLSTSIEPFSSSIDIRPVAVTEDVSTVAQQ
jgi:hypothetical protein